MTSTNIVPSVPVGQKRGILWDEPTISEHDLLRGTRTKITEPKTPYRPMLGIEQLIGGPSSASISEQQARESASSSSTAAAAAAASESSSSSYRRVRAKDFGMATDGLGGILAVNDPRVMSALAKHNAEINSGKHNGSEIKNFPASGGGGEGKGVGGVGGDGDKDEFEKKRKAHYGNVKELLAQSKKAIEEDDDDDEEDDEDKVKEEEEEEEEDS